MVCAGVSAQFRTSLIVIATNLTSARYDNEILNHMSYHSRPIRVSASCSKTTPVFTVPTRRLTSFLTSVVRCSLASPDHRVSQRWARKAFEAQKKSTNQPTDAHSSPEGRMGTNPTDSDHQTGPDDAEKAHQRDEGLGRAECTNLVLISFFLSTLSLKNLRTLIWDCLYFVSNVEVIFFAVIDVLNIGVWTITSSCFLFFLLKILHHSTKEVVRFFSSVQNCNLNS